MSDIQMIAKDFIKIVNKSFQADAPYLTEYYEGDTSLWFRKDDKVVYVDIYGKEDLYCSWVLIVDDPKVEFITKGTVDKITTERVLEIMSEFFEIERITQKKS